MRNSFIIFLLFILFSSCKNKKNEILEYLSDNDSSMWNMVVKEKHIYDNDTLSFERTISFLFRSDYTCEVYNLGPLRRHALRIGPKPNVTGLCNKWEILNDSTIKLNCKDIFVVKMISKDTLYLLDTLGVKKHEMYRVSQPWNIDEKSVKIRDKLIESGEYLSPYIYY